MEVGVAQGCGDSVDTEHWQGLVADVQPTLSLGALLTRKAAALVHPVSVAGEGRLSMVEFENLPISKTAAATSQEKNYVHI